MLESEYILYLSSQINRLLCFIAYPLYKCEFQKVSGNVYFYCSPARHRWARPEQIMCTQMVLLPSHSHNVCHLNELGNSVRRHRKEMLMHLICCCRVIWSDKSRRIHWMKSISSVQISNHFIAKSFAYNLNGFGRSVCVPLAKCMFTIKWIASINGYHFDRRPSLRRMVAVTRRTSVWQSSIDLKIVANAKRTQKEKNWNRLWNKSMRSTQHANGK